MVDQQQKVISPERFSSGLTYEQYFAQIEKNVEKFRYNFDNTQVSDEDRKALRELAAKPNGPKKMLVLGEDWCPDVYRGLPVLARIAEAGGMEFRVFPRDKNLDIMQHFLKDGEFQSIPTAVFYTGDMDYIYHFIERPQQANAEMDQYRAVIGGRSREEAAADVEAFQKGPVWAGWRQATIKEIINELRQRVQ